MARTPFPVQILTPEGEVFADEVEMLSTRTSTGGVGVLANHAPLMATLEPCELRLYKSGSDDAAGADVVRFAQSEGYLQVVDNSALLLVEDATPPDELDTAVVKAHLDDARTRLEQTEEPKTQGLSPTALAAPEYRRATEARRRAEAAVERYETFLRIAEGDGSG